MKNLEHAEIEYKYKIEHENYRKFVSSFEKAYPRVNKMYAEGTDYFYEKLSDKTCFLRHRKSSSLNQLTFKRKLNSRSNVVRTEYNINLDKATPSYHVGLLASEMGFNFNMKLSKKTCIYTTKDYTVAFYHCYDDNNYLGSFLEIELPEGVKWKNKKEAIKKLNYLENKLKKFGSSKKCRINKSLWELFKK